VIVQYTAQQSASSSKLVTLANGGKYFIVEQIISAEPLSVNCKCTEYSGNMGVVHHEDFTFHMDSYPYYYRAVRTGKTNNQSHVGFVKDILAFDTNNHEQCEQRKQ